MREDTLEKVNEFLAELAKQADDEGTVLKPPASIANLVGLKSGLETARAMRALLARKRVEAHGNGYRVVSPEPILPGEKLAIVPERKKRKRSGQSDPSAKDPMPGVPTYADIGRAVVDRLVELSNDLGELRAGRGTEERARMDAAERRASAAEQKVKELTAKLDMAEGNLREVLRAASIAKASGAGTPIDDPEAAAVLRFLQSEPPSNNE